MNPTYEYQSLVYPSGPDDDLTFAEWLNKYYADWDVFDVRAHNLFDTGPIGVPRDSMDAPLNLIVTGRRLKVADQPNEDEDASMGVLAMREQATVLGANDD